MKKIMSLVLIFSILSCNLSAFYVSRNVSLASGPVAASVGLASVLLCKYKLPSSVKFGLGFYGCLAFLSTVNFMAFMAIDSLENKKNSDSNKNRGPGSESDLDSFFIIYSTLVYSGIGILPIGLFAIYDIVKKISGGRLNFSI